MLAWLCALTSVMRAAVRYHCVAIVHWCPSLNSLFAVAVFLVCVDRLFGRAWHRCRRVVTCATVAIAGFSRGMTASSSCWAVLLCVLGVTDTGLLFLANSMHADWRLILFDLILFYFI